MRLCPLSFVLLFAPLTACSCGDDPGGSGDDLGLVDPDGGSGDAGGNPDGSRNDGSVTDQDGGLDRDGGGTDGSPLEQPLSEFCEGMGNTVVVVGGGGECAGELAEETFQFGLCACDTVQVQSTLELDAFDSNLGGYAIALPGGGNNRSDDGNLGINGQLDMQGKLTARGSAYIGSGGFAVGASSLVTGLTYAAGDAVQDNSSTTLGYNAYFSGDVEGRFDIAGDLYVPATATVSAATRNNLGGSVIRREIPAVRPCPCEPAEILDIPALTEWAATHNDNRVERVLTSTSYQNGGPATLNLPCGRYYLTQVNQSGGLDIRAEGRVVLFVDGDFTVGGSLGITIAQGAELDLFVAGQLSVGASARFGDPGAPSKVRTYVGGNGPINLSASAIFGGMLYAPRSDVVFSASSELYGALYCNSADFSGSAAVHFDTAVRSAGRACEMPDGGVDAGPTADGGPGDGGPPADAGTNPDASADAGAPDGGQSGCNGCGQCGNLACIIPPGANTGMCEACQSDLDCCAPLVCQGGQCQFNL